MALKVEGVLNGGMHAEDTLRGQAGARGRLARVGIETADMLVHEVLSRPMRDRKAVARYAGLTGSPDAERTGTVVLSV